MKAYESLWKPMKAYESLRKPTKAYESLGKPRWNLLQFSRLEQQKHYLALVKVWARWNLFVDVVDHVGEGWQHQTLFVHRL